MILDHPPELCWLDAQLVDVVLQRFKLLVYQVHDVLLRLGRIGELLVVLILTHVNLVLEAKGLDVARHPENRLSFDSLNRILLMLLLESIIEVNLELGPALYLVQTIELNIQGTCILVLPADVTR